VNAQNLLGEPLWRPPAPNGFSDDSAAWMDGLAQRLDIANQFARRVGGLIDPEEVADAALGPLASPETRQTLARAESRQQAVALLLMSPELYPSPPFPALLPPVEMALSAIVSDGNDAFVMSVSLGWFARGASQFGRSRSWFCTRCRPSYQS